jgi:WD40 repeat protein
VLTLRGHRGCINTCSFNPYGDRQLTGCDDGCVYLWDIGSRNPLPVAMLAPHHTNVFTTNFLTSSRFISGGNDATVQVVDLAEGRALSTVYPNHHLRKVLCSFVIDDSTFATCSYDQTIRLFDVRTRYPSQRVRALPLLTPADVTHDAIAILDRDLQRHYLRSQSEGGGSILPVRAVDDSSLLVSLQSRRDESQLYTMDIHPIDRKQFITSGSDGCVRMFDLRMIQRSARSNLGFPLTPRYGRCDVTGAAFDETGARIAATVLEGQIHVFRTADFVELGAFDGREPGAEEEDSGVLPGEIVELAGHKSESTIKTVNWQGDFVVSGSDEGCVFWFDAENGNIANVVRAHQANVNVVTVHREKQMLATSGVDDFAVLWEPRRIARRDLKKEEARVNEVLEEIGERDTLEFPWFMS